MTRRKNPFEIVFLTIIVYGVLVALYGDKASPDAFLRLTMLFVIVCAVESVVIGLYVLGKFLFTHEPCPKCHEHSFRKITRIDSGIFDDGSALNPLTIEFDEERNMYVRRYNRKCHSCGHRYFVNEGGWPKGAVQGERTLVMTKVQRDAIRRANPLMSGDSPHTRGKRL